MAGLLGTPGPMPFAPAGSFAMGSMGPPRSASFSPPPATPALFPPRTLSFAGTGRGAWKQEVNYIYVGRGGDFSVEHSRRDRFRRVLLCWGGACLCFLVMLCLVPMLFSDACREVSAMSPMGVLCYPKCLIEECSEIYYSPSGKPFPLHWGEPPEVQTQDMIELPVDYGQGSSTLAAWIKTNLATDAVKGIHYSGNGGAFPRAWGPPPKFNRKGGKGNQPLLSWIRGSNSDNSLMFFSPNGKRYPTSYGAPPMAATLEQIDESRNVALVALPGGYGIGSASVAEWIQTNMDEEQGFFGW